jgi:hypothetical protein
MMSNVDMQMLATGQRTKISGNSKASWRKETLTELTCAELEQKNITAFTLQAHLAK